jgi:cytochrome c-type biogenesis protein CcmF
MIGPQLRWRRDRSAVLPRLAPGVVIAIATLVATFLLAPSIGLLPRLGLALGVGLVPASLAPLAGRSLRRTPLATWGMCLAHLGVAVALIGMASDSAFTREKLTTAVPGEQVQVGPWLVELRSITPVAGPNWTALEAEMRASKGSGVSVLKPQSRFFTEPVTTTNEAAIETDWNGQLYAVLGAQDVATGRWQVRLWWKPFVTLIWLGGALIALGGLLALAGRWWRAFRTRRRFVEAEW